jgi:hypothetical protein
MSLFHKFQDVYFDVIQLADTLEQIPETCDCGDADAHLAGQCNCVAGGTLKPPEGVEQGCLYHLEKLWQKLHWLNEDLHRLKISQLTDQEQNELQKILSLINGAYWLSRFFRKKFFVTQSAHCKLLKTLD